VSVQSEQKRDASAKEWSQESVSIPDHWICASFEDVFDSLSLTGLKIPQKEYEPSGVYPVVDQGADLIGGYTNDERKVINRKKPVIVFGDHTKCFKYLPFPFAPGADGVKVLVPKLEVEGKYLFYACKALQLPDRGYSRHFSFLKKCKFPLSPKDEQRDIVAKIETLFSELDKGIESLKTARQQLKAYRQAVLKHAFEGKLTEQWRQQNSDKLEPPEQLLARIRQEREQCYQQELEDWKQAVKAWEDSGKEGRKPSKPKLPKGSGAEITSENLKELPYGWYWVRLSDLLQSSPQNGIYKPSSEYGDGFKIIRIDNFYDGAVVGGDKLKRLSLSVDEINAYGLALGDLIVNRVNSIEYLGKSALIRALNEPTVFESNIMRCSLVDGSISKEFITLFLNSRTGRKELCKNAKHAVNQASINQSDVGNAFLPLCSYDEQTEVVGNLESKLSQIESLNNEIDTQLEKSEILRQSILKRAFSGQLSSCIASALD